MASEQVPSDDCVVEVELTPEQEARAERLQHDIWCDADAHDAAREIIYLRDRVRQLEKLTIWQCGCGEWNPPASVNCNECTQDRPASGSGR